MMIKVQIVEEMFLTIYFTKKLGALKIVIQIQMSKSYYKRYNWMSFCNALLEFEKAVKKNIYFKESEFRLIYQ